MRQYFSVQAFTFAVHKAFIEKCPIVYRRDTRFSVQYDSAAAGIADVYQFLCCFFVLHHTNYFPFFFLRLFFCFVYNMPEMYRKKNLSNPPQKCKFCGDLLKFSRFHQTQNQSCWNLAGLKLLSYLFIQFSFFSFHAYYFWDKNFYNNKERKKKNEK